MSKRNLIKEAQDMFARIENVQEYYKNNISEAKPNNFLELIYGRKIANEQKMIPLNEISMNRLLGKHYNGAGLAIVSASRGDRTEDENNERTKEMFNLIEHSGFRFIPAFGGYKEKNDNGEVIGNVYEKVAIILCYNNKREAIPFEQLHKFAFNLGVKFEQDSVLIKAPGENPKYIVTNERNGDIGSVDMEFSGDLKINDLTQEFFTNMASKHGNVGQNRFTFTEQYLNPSFVTLNEGHVRLLKGELFLMPNQTKL